MWLKLRVLEEGGVDRVFIIAMGVLKAIKNRKGKSVCYEMKACVVILFWRRKQAEKEVEVVKGFKYYWKSVPSLEGMVLMVVRSNLIPTPFFMYLTTHTHMCISFIYLFVFFFIYNIIYVY